MRFKVLITGLVEKLNSNIGILIIGHGSRNTQAINEFAELVSSLRSFLPSSVPIEYGYLEFSKPVSSEALDRLKEKSVKKVIAIPAMLVAAGHVKNDIPSVLNAYSAERGVEIIYGKNLALIMQAH